MPKVLCVCSKSSYFVVKFVIMLEDRVIIREIEGNEINLLGAEEEIVKFSMTGIFICKEGEITFSLDDAEYHMTKHSIIVYFSYSRLHIISYTPNLRGTLIGTNLETIQPMLYQVSNFNALFVLKKAPLQAITETQYNNLKQHITMLTTMTQREQEERENGLAANRRPVADMARKQAELLSYSLILEVLQCYANMPFDMTPVSRKDEVLQKFVTLLYRKYRTEHEVSYYANQQFLTSRYFSAIVKERSGKSPSQWISTALLVDAQNLLKSSNMTIKEISDLLCFPNQSYFGKWFKNLTTLGPLDYRKGRKSPKDVEDTDFTDVIQRGLNYVGKTQDE